MQDTIEEPLKRGGRPKWEGRAVRQVSFTEDVVRELQRLSRELDVPQARLIREGVDLMLAKYRNNL